MRVFVTKWFTRFADREAIEDVSLLSAIVELERGEWDADLGGGVYKQRLARRGAGKSGGYRLIVCFRQGRRTFFVFGFAKSDRDNLTRNELKLYKQQANILFAMTDGQLDEALRRGTFRELREAGDDQKI